jgi:hypothetical protein
MKQMKNILFVILVALGLSASAQQVNPVPDYTFANRMSAGRNTVTDTAAYFSIGPRYGAIRGMMPPMVVDTAAVSGNKRNGLLIFSVQKNKFLYWDSVGVKWAEMAGTGGTAINSGDTAAMLSPYVRHAGYGITKSGQAFIIDTALMATRLRVGKVVDSLSSVKQNVLTNPVTGTGTTNYISKFTGTSTIGNSQIFDNGTNVLVGYTTPLEFKLGVKGTIAGVSSDYGSTATSGGSIQMFQDNSSYGTIWATSNYNTAWGNVTLSRLGGEVLVRTSTDAGDFSLQVSGNQYISGNLGIATTSPQEKLHIVGNERVQGDIMTGYGSAASYKIEVGNSRTGNGSAFIDLVGDATYTDFGLRLIRNDAGANASSSLAHRGTGELNLFNYDLAPIVFVINSTEVGRWSSSGELLLNNAGIDSGNYKLQVTGAIYNTTTITTGAPTSGTAKPWRLGEAATVSPTSPNRTIRVEIDGTVYFIHAKTTND